MAIFAEVTENECIVDSTCAIYIHLAIFRDNPFAHFDTSVRPTL